MIIKITADEGISPEFALWMAKMAVDLNRFDENEKYYDIMSMKAQITSKSKSGNIFISVTKDCNNQT